MMRFLPLALVIALGAASPARAEAPDAPPAKTVEVAKTPAQQTQELFDRLAITKDSDEAAGIETALDRLRLRSGSDTTDLLMSRAIEAMSQENYPLALSLLDATIDLRPEWAEAWNKRATVRYFAGDPKGSMADIAQTLKREPRHLGALAGMGAILNDAGMLDDALRAYERALQIAPAYEPMKGAAEKVKAALARRSL